MFFNSLEVEAAGESSTWHQSKVPYKPGANTLQNLDDWIPAVKRQELPQPSSLPAAKDLWIIYIHGDVWRHPLMGSASFAATVKELTANHFSVLPKLPASPHWTTLSPLPTDKLGKLEPQLSAMHPDHIVDVLTSSSYLQAKAGFGSKCVLPGHSCGATHTFKSSCRISNGALEPPLFKSPNQKPSLSERTI